MKKHLVYATIVAIFLSYCNNLEAWDQKAVFDTNTFFQQSNGQPLVFENETGQICKKLGLPHDGKIKVMVDHFAELVELEYLDKNGCWINGSYEKLKYHFRSRGDNQEGDFDKRLVELADHLQDHFNAGLVNVISVYRSPDFNAALKKAGRGVAKNSRHTRGEAMDVHLPNTPDHVLRDYLLSLKLGGVGYYPNMMVHVDFGPVRRW